MGTTEGMSVFQFIMAGGPIMWPILLCSVFALGIIITKLIYLGSIQTDPYELKNKVFALVKDNRIKEAVELCNTNPSPVAKILKAGILKFGCSREEIKETIEGISLFEIPTLEKNLNLSAIIANVCPLLGLLGTVTGMITVFQTIQVRAASLNPVTPGDLAGGIWQALLTTVASLIVSIPAFVGYNYCVSRVNTIVLDMERAATELVNFLCHISESSPMNMDDKEDPPFLG